MRQVVSVGLCVSMLGMTIHVCGQSPGQLWNEDKVQKKITSRVSASAAEGFRFSNGQGLYHYYTDGRVGLDVRTWFNAGINYRFIRERKDDAWATEHRPYISGVFKWQGKPIVLEQRNRLECRIRSGKDTALRYRGGLKLSGHMGWQLVDGVYLFEEAFIDFPDVEYNRNRLSCGVRCTATKHLLLDLHYLLQSDYTGKEWTGTNVLGINVYLKLS